MGKIVVCSYCLECSKRIYSLLIVHGSENSFCEDYEIGYYEDKCNC